MRTSTRLLVLLGSLALLLLFLLPLWRIDLHAPQYPEGLGLRIAVDGIYGERPHDLQNINGLNHYIGMRPIEPESIPELRFMPYIVAALVAFGLLTAAAGRRGLLLGWTAALVLAAGAGLGDFYRWGHAYGHELDPQAAIQVPGMTYQPPLVGSKQLLNMRAVSWPAAGGWIGVGVGLLALVLVVREVRSRPRVLAAAAGIAVLLGGCGAEPRPIAYGEDQCELCRMVVADERFGTELVRRTGRSYTFDSIECLATFYRDSIARADVASVWVTDYAQPRQLLDAERAVYVHAAGLHSPMGAGLAAFPDSGAARATATVHEGTVLEWAGVLEHVARSWRPGAGHGRGSTHSSGP